jgi:hypothetical protein
MPRRPYFDSFDRPPPQVIRIWSRHPGLQKNRINAARIVDPQAFGNPPIRPERDML